jgi:hypothetical protein
MVMGCNLQLLLRESFIELKKILKGEHNDNSSCVVAEVLVMTSMRGKMCSILLFQNSNEVWETAGARDKVERLVTPKAK